MVALGSGPTADVEPLLAIVTPRGAMEHAAGRWPQRDAGDAAEGGAWTDYLATEARPRALALTASVAGTPRVATLTAELQIDGRHGRPYRWQIAGLRSGFAYVAGEPGELGAAVSSGPDSISDRRGRIVAEATMDGILIHERGIVIEANSVATSLLGWKREELIGRPALDLVHPDSYGEVLGQLAAGSEEPYELWGTRADGTRLRCEVRGRSLRHEQPGRRVTAIRDVTSERAARERLRRELSTTEAVGRLSQALLGESELAQVPRLVLEAAQSLTESAIGFVGYIDPVTGNLVCPTLSDDVWDRCRVAGKSAEFTKRGGMWGWALDHCEAVICNDLTADPRSTGTPTGHVAVRRFLAAPALIAGETVGLIALANSPRDYDEFDLETTRRLATLYAMALQRSRMEDRLRNHAHLLETLLDTIPSPVFYKDANGVFLGCNQVYATEAVGLPREQIVGRTLSDLCPPLERGAVERFEAQDHLLLADGGAQRYDVHGIDGTDTPRSYTVLKAAFGGGDGVPAGIVGVLVDITAQLAREEELRDARDAAQAADRAKSAFLANMSHELRTPLNGVIGMTDLLLGTDLDPAKREYAETVRRSADHLLSIIGDILEFAQLEAGDVALASDEFDAGDLAAQVFGVLRQQAGGKSLEAVLEIDCAAGARLVGDAGRIRQALLILCANAVKFTAAGSITLKVATRPSASGAELICTVLDTGPGIARDKVQRLLEPFSQADESTTRQHGGLGLGLSILHQLLRRMEGRLSIQTEEGIGSAVSFALPLRSAMPAAEASAARVAAGLGLRVLLAEDNQVNQKVALHMLKRLGCEAVLARSGREAVERYGAEAFDAVLMDCHMPEMDGFEATEAIRAGENGHRTPIIAMTAGALPADREACLQCGMDDHLAKPVKTAALEAALRRWCNGG